MIVGVRTAFGDSSSFGHDIMLEGPRNIIRVTEIKEFFSDDCNLALASCVVFIVTLFYSEQGSSRLRYLRAVDNFFT